MHLYTHDRRSDFCRVSADILSFKLVFLFDTDLIEEIKGI